MPDHDACANFLSVRSHLELARTNVFSISRILVGSTLAAMIAGAPHAVRADHDDVTSFGYRPLGSPTLPLLTILLDFDGGNFDADHDTNFYRDLLFYSGAPVGTIAGAGSFYAEQSADEFGLGAFTFENAGVIGPFPNPDDPATSGDESTFQCARGIDSLNNPVPPTGTPGGTVIAAPCGFWVWDSTNTQWENQSLQTTLANAIIAADQAGFPFRDYDTNGNNIVEQNELVILVVYAPSALYGPGGVADYSTGGAVRNPSFRPFVDGASGLRVSMGVATVGENVAADMLSHELGHVLQYIAGGSYEAYGSGRGTGRPCLNGLFTVMGCSSATPESRAIFHHDPFTKMKFGFLRPEVAHIGDFLCTRMEPIEDTPGPDTRALILYDPARGTNEFFILDYRRPLALNYDGDPWATGRTGLPDKGLGIWYVQIDSSGWPVRINALDGTSGQDSALFLVPPGFADDPTNWAFPSGNNGLWGPEDGAADLTWPDGTSTGTQVRVLQESGGELFLQISSGPDCLYVPKPTLTEFTRIDQGVDRWDNGFLTVTRTISAPILGSKAFSVQYTLLANADTSGPIFIADAFPDDFSALPGDDSSLAFPILLKDQEVSRGYSMLAGDLEGGFDVETEIVLSTISDNPENATPPEVYKVSSFLSVWNPNSAKFADNAHADFDGDDISDHFDQCPNQNAYGFDSDRDGCIDSLPDLKFVLEGLQKSGAIGSGIGTSLGVHIANAEIAESSTNYQAAAGNLQGLVGEVNGLTAKQIPAYEAYLITGYAEAIKAYYSTRASQNQ